ncbi:hypothetical protein CONCODRAFT_78618 [Conidiobolus coronatus NRRL 28638]|uniref:Cyclin N-terminal domain-containing protein n=1 Tax=Conidiobolus coronatus (strain ATCC 28846 / CBS 209.66 / NRRL 28638) TaxID=796925 RepID=A0A137P7E2_CONC2|nr:hypothetical protein CONCODRAFT_78618 [Conidiobolus coronatus NRRL 28638]|eukprot:KXN70937.1 hypothetical protein CONCODRAFT_78618 [Conidiobolus coronatus NRRL 28638]
MYCSREASQHGVYQALQYSNNYCYAPITNPTNPVGLHNASNTSLITLYGNFTYHSIRALFKEHLKFNQEPSLPGFQSCNQQQLSLKYFCHRFFNSVNCDHPSIVITTLQYLDRIVKSRPNWVGIKTEIDLFLVSFVLSTKYLLDVNILNSVWCDYIKIPVKEFNQLERSVLQAFGHVLTIDSQLYDHYANQFCKLGQWPTSMASSLRFNLDQFEDHPNRFTYHQPTLNILDNAPQTPPSSKLEHLSYEDTPPEGEAFGDPLSYRALFHLNPIITMPQFSTGFTQQTAKSLYNSYDVDQASYDMNTMNMSLQYPYSHNTLNPAYYSTGYYPAITTSFGTLSQSHQIFGAHTNNSWSITHKPPMMQYPYQYPPIPYY